MKAITVDPHLELKKQTLTAWAFILLQEGIIDLTRCNRMIAVINALHS